MQYYWEMFCELRELWEHFSPFNRFNDEVKHIKVIEKDNWIHITEAKKFESLLVREMSCSFIMLVW